MPVSFLPLVVPVLLIGVPLLCLMVSKRAALIAAIFSFFSFAVIIVPVYVNGLRMQARAETGDAESAFEYARWLENHSGRINRVILWPFSRPDVEKGYEWVERAAEEGHPEAMYALGVRLKYGLFVPKPKGWMGPTGNVFPQPERGQEWIDRAIKGGYQPTIQEDWYYWQVFRK